MLATTQDAQEFRKQFYSFYHGKIIPALSRYEALRLKKKSIHTCLGIIGGLLGAFSFYLFAIIMLNKNSNSLPPFQILPLIVSFLFFTGILFLTNKISKDFENFVKSGVFKIFLSFFGDFTWSPTGRIPESDIIDSALFSTFNRYKSDDFFEGMFKDLFFVISEINLKHETGSGKNRRVEHIFNGILIKISMLKPFHGRTLITRDRKYFGFFQDLIGSSMKKVELEDPEFNKMFDVVSDDQVEARYLLTTTFIERFKNLKNIYKVNDIRASFLDKSITIAIPCPKDMFKLGDLYKPITDAGQFKTLFEEFVAVLSLVELLKLDSKTGL